jgi:hypothetical protein
MQTWFAGVATGLLLLPSAALAAPNDAGLAAGQTVTTKTGCVSPEPYALFEDIYGKEGRIAAYKALVGTQKCQRLPGEMEVTLEEAVGSFDYGWGKGRIWRVSPIEPDAKAPDTFFIRSRLKGE